MSFIDQILNRIASIPQAISGGVQNYQQQVAEQKQLTPFFNKDNTPTDWAFNKLPQDVKKRGVIEGLHDLTNPVIMNPYIQPIAEPMIGNTRMYVSKIPNQNVSTQIARKLLGLPPTINKNKWPK